MVPGSVRVQRGSRLDVFPQSDTSTPEAISEQIDYSYSTLAEHLWLRTTMSPEKF